MNTEKILKRSVPADSINPIPYYQFVLACEPEQITSSQLLNVHWIQPACPVNPLPGKPTVYSH